MARNSLAATPDILGKKVSPCSVLSQHEMCLKLMLRAARQQRRTCPITGMFPSISVSFHPCFLAQHLELSLGLWRDPGDLSRIPSLASALDSISSESACGQVNKEPLGYICTQRHTSCTSCLSIYVACAL